MNKIINNNSNNEIINNNKWKWNEIIIIMKIMK